MRIIETGDLVEFAFPLAVPLLFELVDVVDFQEMTNFSHVVVAGPLPYRNRMKYPKEDFCRVVVSFAGAVR